MTEKEEWVKKFMSFAGILPGIEELHEADLDAPLDEFEEVASGRLEDMSEEHYNLFLAQYRTEPSREEKLEELRVEFEAAREAWLDEVGIDICCENSNGLWYQDYLGLEQLTVGSHPDIEWFANVIAHLPCLGIEVEEEAVEQAARRYIIARDFNEFRDGHWQTL